MSELSSAIEDALDTRDMIAACTDVKGLVCDELKRVDPNAVVQTTDYFNHSFVPDILLAWPDGVEREVFLRFVDPQYLKMDLDRIGTAGPIVFDISSASTRNLEVAVDSPQDTLNQFEAVMITDAEATEQIRPRRNTNSIVEMVTANVLKAGRGEYSGESARQLMYMAQIGFEGVLGLNPSMVEGAMQTFEEKFDIDFERRIERLLQLFWWANGGSPGLFPTMTLDDLTLNAGDTRDFLRHILLGELDVTNDSFWSRLADRLDFDLLVGTGPIGGTSNLGKLMKELAPRLKLSHASLDSIERPFPPNDNWHWSISDKFIIFSGGDWRCQLTPQGNRFSQRHSQGSPVSLREANQRSKGLRIGGAEIHEASRLVRLTRIETETAPRHFASLDSLTEGFEDDDQVRKVVVEVGGSEVEADFDRMLLSSDPDSSVQNLTILTLSLLTSLTNDEKREVDDILNTVNLSS